MVSFDRGVAASRLRSEAFDVLVVGGGIIGCGVALDAASRGLRTALVEAGDFAAGTSSKSSKLVHGGLRYLSQHDYRLVYEALAERQRLLRNAGHLVHPLPFLIPLFAGRKVSGSGHADVAVAKGIAKAYSVALWLYDLTGGLRIGRRHRRIDAATVSAHFPALRTEALAAGFVYWDAQADDARLTLAVARTAALAHGAVVVNHTTVAALLTDPASGQVSGVRLDDGATVDAGVVVNAAGVWSGVVAAMPGGGSPAIALRPAKGVHLTVRSERLACDRAAVLPVPGDKRSIFVVPWEAAQAPGPSAPGRYTYLGTTDTDYDGPLDDPRCDADDVDYILRAVNAWTSASLTPEDVTASWAGLRPLVSDASDTRTADLSRRHQVIVSTNGLVTVTGGKLTTYRSMAADAVDAAFGVLGRPRRPCRTKSLRLLGAPPGRQQPDAPTVEAAGRLGLGAGVIAHLWGRFGTETPEVLDLCRHRADLAEPLVAGLPYLRAEVVYAVRSEMAVTLDDVVARRTRALILDRAATATAARPAAELLGAEFGWDAAQIDAEVDALNTQLDAEAAAAAVRTGRPRIVAPAPPP